MGRVRTMHHLVPGGNQPDEEVRAIWADQGRSRLQTSRSKAVENLARLLKEHPFLSGLEQRHLEFLTGCASNVRYAAGEFLFKEGQESDASYLVRTGRVALEISVPGRGPVQLQTVEAGEVLGWSWLYPPYRWQFRRMGGRTGAGAEA